MKRIAALILLLLMATVFAGAGYEEKLEYTFFADTEEEAEEIAECLGAELVEYQYGIGVVCFKEETEETEETEESMADDSVEKYETNEESETEKEIETEAESETENEAESEIETDNETENEIGNEIETETESKDSIIKEEENEADETESKDDDIEKTASHEEDSERESDEQTPDNKKKRKGIPDYIKINGKEINLYPEIIYTVEEVSANSEQLEQWHLTAIEIEELWEKTKGDGILVAVIDTGIDTEHEDLKGNISGAETVIPDEMYGTGATYLEKYRGPYDNFGHGTHVAGIIGAEDNGLGCIGIAPECNILSIKALEKNGNKGSGKSSWVAAGINLAVEKGAKIVNLSLGGSTVKDELLHQTISEATQKGVFVVCAAGNVSKQQIIYPGAYEETIAVSALKQDGDGMSFASGYSNYGDWIDISAPGSSVRSTIPNGYGIKSGTSMATPVISGAIALTLSMDSGLSRQEVLDILYESAVDLGTTGKDAYYGYGAVNGRKILETYQTKKNIADTPGDEGGDNKEDKKPIKYSDNKESDKREKSNKDNDGKKNMEDEIEEAPSMLPEDAETDWLYVMEETTIAEPDGEETEQNLSSDSEIHSSDKSEESASDEDINEQVVTQEENDTESQTEEETEQISEEKEDSVTFTLDEKEEPQRNRTKDVAVPAGLSLMCFGAAIIGKLRKR